VYSIPSPSHLNSAEVMRNGETYDEIIRKLLKLAKQKKEECEK